MPGRTAVHRFLGTYFRLLLIGCFECIDSERGVLADRGLLKGKTVGADATTLEANAAIRSSACRDSGAYNEFLKDLAKQSLWCKAFGRK